MLRKKLDLNFIMAPHIIKKTNKDLIIIDVRGKIILFEAYWPFLTKPQKESPM
jgi:hypothetical protein